MRADWLKGRIYAHRGWHGDGRIENSPSAFRAAIAAGLGIECDVQRSADGEAMVFHDWELDRLTGERGAVLEWQSAALGCVRLKGSEDTLWTLPQLLAEISGKVPLLVEIKSRREVAFAPLCAAVRDALRDYAGDVAVMSFDPRVVRWFAGQAPAIVRGLVMSEDRDGLWRQRLATWHSQPDFLAYDVRNLPSAFAAAQRRRGRPVLTWTVSDSASLQRARKHADGPIAEAQGLEEALASH